MNQDPDRKEAWIEALISLCLFGTSLVIMVTLIWVVTKIFG